MAAGRLDEAEGVARQMLLRDQDDFAAHFALGEIALRRGHSDQAIPHFRRCLRLDPGHVGSLAYLGRLVLEQGEKAEALRCFREILRREARNPHWHYIIGQYLWDLGRREEALATYRRLVAMRPDALDIAAELGERLLAAGHLDEAERLNLALAVRDPRMLNPHLNLGRIYRLQGKAEQARVAFAAALAQDPDHPEALTGLAWALLTANQLAAAESLLARVMARPGDPGPDALQLAARVREGWGDYAEAIRLMSLAIMAGAHDPNNYLLLALWQDAINDPLAAVAILEAGIQHAGDQASAFQVLLFYTRLSLCDWRDYAREWPRVLALLTGPAPPRQPVFFSLQLPGLSRLDLRRLTHAYAAIYDPWAQRPLAPAARVPAKGRRLRIGYLSADFHAHATAYLTAAVFEHHAASRFEVFAYSHGPDDASPTRHRLRAAFEHFIEIGDLDHAAAARRIREDGIDILVDLKGYTRHARPTSTPTPPPT